MLLSHYYWGNNDRLPFLFFWVLPDIVVINIYSEIIYDQFISSFQENTPKYNRFYLWYFRIDLFILPNCKLEFMVAITILIKIFFVFLLTSILCSLFRISYHILFIIILSLYIIHAIIKCFISRLSKCNIFSFYVSLIQNLPHSYSDQCISSVVTNLN